MKSASANSFTRKSCASFLFAVALLSSSPLFAAHPLISEDTGTQGEDKFQLELNAEKGRDNSGDVKTDTLNSNMTLSYGFRENADIIFTLPHQNTRTDTDGEITTARGFSDVAMDLKWRFYEAEKISFALKPGFTYPSGDENQGLGSGKAKYGLYFITSIDPAPWTYHIHVGYLRNRNTADEREGIWHASFGGWYTNGKLRLIYDAGINTNTDKTAKSNPAFLILGAIYSVTEDFDLDVGIKKVNNPATDPSLLAGITLRW